MALVSEEEKNQMKEEDQRDYCKWCWGHDYGNCDNCALYIKLTKKN